MSSRETSALSALEQQFPLFLHEDFDLPVGSFGWTVGAKSDYPEELVRRIIAAQISYQLNLKSIDRVYQKYAQEASLPMSDPSRLDLRISRAVDMFTSEMHNRIYAITASDNKRLGEVICEWTLFRFSFACKMMLSCANKGALFESLAIARSTLEQLAWAVTVDPLDDAETIKRTSATRSITHLSSLHLGAGKLYGWLSGHAHWAYDAHAKAITSQDGQLGIMLASPLFKARAMAVLILICDIGRVAFERTKHADLTTLESSGATEKMDHPVSAEGTLDTLLVELKGYAPDDPDLNAIADFLKAA